MRQIVVGHGGGSTASSETHETPVVQRRSSQSSSTVSATDDSPDGSLAKQSVSRILQHLAVVPTDNDYRVTYCELFSAFSSILGRIISILLTINVAYEYYRHARLNYFWWTVTCFVVPMVVTTCVQIVMLVETKFNIEEDKFKLVIFIN